jgi:hypothetical protein
MKVRFVMRKEVHDLLSSMKDASLGQLLLAVTLGKELDPKLPIWVHPADEYINGEITISVPPGTTIGGRPVSTITLLAENVSLPEIEAAEKLLRTAGKVPAEQRGWLCAFPKPNGRSSKYRSRPRVLARTGARQIFTEKAVVGRGLIGWARSASIGGGKAFLRTFFTYLLNHHRRSMRLTWSISQCKQ